MKKMITLIVAVLLCNSISAQSQETANRSNIFTDSPKLNEVKINLPNIIFNSFPEISYERILDSDISLGVSAGAAINMPEAETKYSFTPYFRWFFGGNKKSTSGTGAGFFIEANTSVFSRQLESFSLAPGGVITSTTKVGIGYGAGMAIGWKYISRNGWVGEIYTGAGRDFINKGEFTYSRIGVSIGKCF